MTKRFVIHLYIYIFVFRGAHISLPRTLQVSETYLLPMNHKHSISLTTSQVLSPWQNCWNGVLSHTNQRACWIDMQAVVENIECGGGTEERVSMVCFHFFISCSLLEALTLVYTGPTPCCMLSTAHLPWKRSLTLSKGNMRLAYPQGLSINLWPLL